MRSVSPLALLMSLGSGGSSGRIFHASTLNTLAILAVLNVTLLIAGTYAFFKTYFRDRRAPLYGLIAVFGSWWAA
jgi:hypothetical protein